MVPAALVAGLTLVLSACTLVNQEQTSNSPDTTPSTAAASPTTSPTTGPVGTPTSTPTGTPTSTPAGAALKITSLPFHSGEVGIAYGAVFFGASGGSGPYSWAISAGTLPGGLSLSSGGQLGGTPSAAGHPSLTIQVADSAGHVASAPGSFVVYSALAATQPCTSICAVEEGCTVCGVFGHVSGGLGPYHYKITSDNRPDGMGVSGLTLTGPFPPPGPIGQFDMTVRVSDGLGAARNVTGQWFVFSHIAFTVSNFTCVGRLTSGCTATTTYTGGTPGLVSPALTPTLVSTTPAGMALPPGTSFDASSGAVTVTFPSVGCGNQQFDKTWVVSLVLVDKSVCSSAGNCSSAPSKVTVFLANSC